MNASVITLWLLCAPFAALATRESLDGVDRRFHPAILFTAFLGGPATIALGVAVSILALAWCGLCSGVPALWACLCSVGRSYAALWRARPRRRPKPDDAIPRAEVRR